MSPSPPPLEKGVGTVVTDVVGEALGGIDVSGGCEPPVGTLEGWSDPRRNPLGEAVVPGGTVSSSGAVGTTVFSAPVGAGVSSTWLIDAPGAVVGLT